MPRSVALSDTSLAAWRSINADGRLSRARLAVYNCIADSGPMTQNDIDRILGPSAHKRVSELVDRRVVAAVGERLDPRTGETNTLWDVTSSLPVEPIKPDVPVLVGDAKALAEIKAAIPESRRSPELRALLERLEGVGAPTDLASLDSFD